MLGEAKIVGAKESDQYLLGKPFSLGTFLKSLGKVCLFPLAFTVDLTVFAARWLVVEPLAAGSVHVYKAFNSVISDNNALIQLRSFFQDITGKPTAWSMEPGVDVARYFLHKERAVLKEPDPYGILAKHNQERQALEHAGEAGHGGAGGGPGTSPLYPSGAPVDIQHRGLLL